MSSGSPLPYFPEDILFYYLKSLIDIPKLLAT